MPGAMFRNLACAGDHVLDRAERAGVCIAVQDTGIGQSSEEQQQLFTKFLRAQQPQVREVGGTGLGLAVSRSIAHRHEGDLTVESTPGVGSRFRMALPLPEISVV